MTESSAPLRATLKAGGGYDVPWITVEANNPDDLEQKLRGIIDSKVLETVAEAASMFQATQNAAPLTQPQQAQQQAPAPQAAPQQQNSGWGAAAQQPQQQAAPPQQQGGGRSQHGAQLHPDGTQCAVCGEVLQHAMTRTNKAQWKCPQYRWNNGNPNNHTLEWAN